MNAVPRRRFRGLFEVLNVVAGLFAERGDGVIGWRTRIEWRTPITFSRCYVRYPRLDILPRPPAEHQSAATPADWKPGEQSDNLQTRKP